jgi:hypothetical protein
MYNNDFEQPYKLVNPINLLGRNAGKRILWSRAVECDKTGEMTTCVWSMISILSCNNGRTFWHDYKSSNISSMSKVRSCDYSQSFVNMRCL